MRTSAFVTSLMLLLVIDQKTLGQLPLSSFENYSNTCPDNCDEDEQRPVCGSDGRTYDSQCELDRVKCEGQPVEFSYRGKCIETTKRCLASRKQAELTSTGTPSPFIPECKEDGSFAEIQCYSGYCWCVDIMGKPLPRSSVKNSRPNCVKEARKNTKRKPPKKNKKACGTAERTMMNDNLLNIFRSEYNRFPQPTDNIDLSNILFDTEQKRIIQWKFTQLDLNSDEYLRKNEVKDLKRMVKKIVKPKLCSRTFTKYCDLDEDKKISRTEWSACLGVDLNNEQVDIPSQDTNLQEEVKLPSSWSDNMPLKTVIQSEEANFSEEDEPQDCITARTRALEIEKREPNTGQFVPECTDDGYYRQTQCHKQDTFNSLLCWCVNTRTGEPIRKTTTRRVRPECNKRKSFKGCSLHRKQAFLDEFLRFLADEMMENNKNKSRSQLATQEQVVRWKFDLLDVNKNKMIDKKEWGVFRDEWKDFQKISRRRKLRKCWRNLPKFCDDDKDAKVSIDEWLKCTEVTRDSRGSPPPLNRKKGKQNPFIDILKSD